MRGTCEFSAVVGLLPFPQLFRILLVLVIRAKFLQSVVVLLKNMNCLGSVSFSSIKFVYDKPVIKGIFDRTMVFRDWFGWIDNQAVLGEGL